MELRLIDMFVIVLLVIILILIYDIGLKITIIIGMLARYLGVSIVDKFIAVFKTTAISTLIGIISITALIIIITIYLYIRGEET
jgi:hypothetical protein